MRKKVLSLFACAVLFAQPASVAFATGKDDVAVNTQPTVSAAEETVVEPTVLIEKLQIIEEGTLVPETAEAIRALPTEDMTDESLAEQETAQEDTANEQPQDGTFVVVNKNGERIILKEIHEPILPYIPDKIVGRSTIKLPEWAGFLPELTITGPKYGEVTPSVAEETGEVPADSAEYAQTVVLTRSVRDESDNSASRALSPDEQEESAELSKDEEEELVKIVLPPSPQGDNPQPRVIGPEEKGEPTELLLLDDALAEELRRQHQESELAEQETLEKHVVYTGAMLPNTGVGDMALLTTIGLLFVVSGFWLWGKGRV